MSRVQIKEMSSGGHEAGVCGAREPMCDQEEREKGAKGERQTASQHNDSGRPHAAHNAM